MKYPFNRTPDVATVLAQLCCHEGRRPRGAYLTADLQRDMCPTRRGTQRPLHVAALRLYPIRRRHDHFDKPARFPSALATVKADGVSCTVTLGKDLVSAITLAGFKVNDAKVRMRTPDRRQEVTGLTVNEFPNVDRKFIRQIRAMLHAWEIYGYDSAQNEWRRRYDKRQTLRTRDVLPSPA